MKLKKKVVYPSRVYANISLLTPSQKKVAPHSHVLDVAFNPLWIFACGNKDD